MKQIAASKNCVAIVACMATGCRVYDVDLFLGINSAEIGITDYEFYKFMLHKGYCLGIGIEAKWDEGLHVSDMDSILVLEYKVGSYPAFIIVKSETNPEYAHAIYWDGKQVWDPNPVVEDGRPISDYEIYRWFPIIKAEDKTPENNKEQFTISDVRK